MLDELASLHTAYPEAAVLRARIALEEGNRPFAIRFLDQQIRQFGDVPQLRETYASALYLAGRWQEATDQLNVALKLGTPLWRVAYGRGLIEEGRGRFGEAKVHYQEAIQNRPGWRLPESRMRALVATGRIPE